MLGETGVITHAQVYDAAAKLDIPLLRILTIANITDVVRAIKYFPFGFETSFPLLFVKDTSLPFRSMLGKDLPRALTIIYESNKAKELKAAGVELLIKEMKHCPLFLCKDFEDMKAFQNTNSRFNHDMTKESTWIQGGKKFCTYCLRREFTRIVCTQEGCKEALDQAGYNYPAGAKCSKCEGIYFHWLCSFCGSPRT